MRADDLKRFRAKLDWEGACLVFTGARTSHGYGNFKLEGRARLAHVVAWEHARGRPLPRTWRGGRAVLDHLCRNRRCVRPSHLQLTNNRQNTIRGYRARGKG